MKAESEAVPDSFVARKNTALAASPPIQIKDRSCRLIPASTAGTDCACDRQMAYIQLIADPFTEQERRTGGA